MNEPNSIKAIQDNINKKEQEGSEASKALTTTSKKMKKHHVAKKLVQEAKSIVKASESELQDCRLLLEEDLREYEAAKQALKEGGLDEAKALLLDLGHTIVPESDEEEGIVFEAKEDVKSLDLKDVYSGRFTGFLLSLIGGVITFASLLYWATEKLGMTLDITKIPSYETYQSIFGWFGTQIGKTDDALIGSILVGVSVLAVMVLIYILRVWLKGSSNLRFAEHQMKETQKYITYKSNCKAEMDRVDAHITEAITVLKDYEVVLHEQNGKLKRIQHFEGNKSNTSDFHGKSLQEMKETENLIEHIGRFIGTPMSEEGKLSGKSTLFLHSAKEAMQKILARFS